MIGLVVSIVVCGFVIIFSFAALSCSSNDWELFCDSLFVVLMDASVGGGGCGMDVVGVAVVIGGSGGGGCFN